jgi:hypothetical protein
MIQSRESLIPKVIEETIEKSNFDLSKSDFLWFSVPFSQKFPAQFKQNKFLRTPLVYIFETSAECLKVGKGSGIYRINQHYKNKPTFTSTLCRSIMLPASEEFRLENGIKNDEQSVADWILNSTKKYLIFMIGNQLPSQKKRMVSYIEMDLALQLSPRYEDG